jgi:hypothetical protein
MVAVSMYVGLTLIEKRMSTSTLRKILRGRDGYLVQGWREIDQPVKKGFTDLVSEGKL